jgi:hypothetical protein
VEERDRWREGGPSVAVGGWPMADRKGRVMHARVAHRRAGEVGSLTRGPGATVTGGTV